MHGLRSIEYTGGTLLLVQCLKKKIEARGAKNRTGTRKSCEEKRKEEEKTRENLGLFVTKNPICLRVGENAHWRLLRQPWLREER